MASLIWTPSITHQDEIEIPTLSIKGARENPLIIYHHGLYGEKDGKHAKNIAALAHEENCDFISFDNLGHGTNTSIPLEQADMEGWISTTKHMIQEHAIDRDIILVGNSFGAAALLHAVTELEIEDQIVGFSGIGAIVDSIQREMQMVLNSYFLPNIYQEKPILDAEIKTQYDAGNTIYAPYPNHESSFKIPISQNFLEAGKKYTLLKNNEDIKNGAKFTSDQKFQCRVYLHRGINDPIVTEERMEELASAFRYAGATVYTEEIEESDHSLHSIAARESIQFGVKQMIDAHKFAA